MMAESTLAIDKSLAKYPGWHVRIPEKLVRPLPGQNGVEHLLDSGTRRPFPCQHVNRGDARDHPTADGVAKVQQTRQSLGR